jgi:hypothetical protein
MDNKGQGTVFFWVNALIGVVVVVVIYIVFDYVIYGELVPALVPLGLNMTSQPMVALGQSWNLWAVAFVAAWALALIVRAIIREPNVGF